MGLFFRRATQVFPITRQFEFKGMFPYPVSFAAIVCDYGT
jgi:hypothetical protein